MRCAMDRADYGYEREGCVWEMGIELAWDGRNDGITRGANSAFGLFMEYGENSAFSYCERDA
jgi:hypothetical protein